MEVVKTIKARIQANDEQSRQLEDLYATWNEMLKYCVRNYLSQFWRSKGRTLYAPLREQFPRLQSYHILAVIEVAEGKVQRVKTAIENGDYKAKLQKRWGNDPVQLYHGQTYRIVKKDDDLYARIAYTPRNMIEVKLQLTERDELLTKEALDGKYKLGGALLLKKGDEWLLHISIEKTESLPKWEDYETIIGVDIGMRNLAYAVAYDVANRRFHGESFSMKGNYYNHVLRTYRRKLVEIESKCGKISKRYRKVNTKYNRVRDEIFHTVSKKVVEYAKKFRKPIIVMEDLSKLESNGTTKFQRYRLSMWARKRIHQYIAYKATWGGTPYIVIDPHYTSVTCNKCGKRGERDKWRFKCRYCGYIAYVDENASRNIALKAWKIIARQNTHRSPQRLVTG